MQMDQPIKRKVGNEANKAQSSQLYSMHRQ